MSAKPQAKIEFVDQGRSAFRYRIFALLYDTLIVIALWAVTTGLLVLISGKVVTGALLQSIFFVETFAFCCFFWIHRGQTIGMLAWKLRLVSPSGFTLGSALYRFCGDLLSILTLGLGYYWIWIDKNRRSWSDIFSNSYVVRYQKQSSSIDFSQEQDSTRKDDHDR